MPANTRHPPGMTARYSLRWPRGSPKREAARKDVAPQATEAAGERCLRAGSGAEERGGSGATPSFSRVGSGVPTTTPPPTTALRRGQCFREPRKRRVDNRADGAVAKPSNGESRVVGCFRGTRSCAAARWTWKGASASLELLRIQGRDTPRLTLRTVTVDALDHLNA